MIIYCKINTCIQSVSQRITRKVKYRLICTYIYGYKYKLYVYEMYVPYVVIFQNAKK